MNSERNNRLWWGLIILCLCTAWPVGLILLFLKLFKNTPSFHTDTDPAAEAQTEQEPQPLSQAQREEVREKFRPEQGQSGSQAAGSGTARSSAGNPYQYSYTYSYTAPKNASGTATRWSQSTKGVRSSELHGSPSSGTAKKETAKAPAGKKKAGLWARIFGGAMTGIFGFAAVTSLLELLAEGAGAMEILKEVNPLMIFCALGVALLALGVQRGNKQKRLKRYRTLLGNSLSLDLHTAARTTGVRYERVLDDVQEFTDRGEFGNAFVDVERGLLIVDAEHYAPPAEQPEQKAPTSAQEIAQQAVQASKQSDNEVLAQIKAANDAIDNEEISRKIDEIGMLTAKILRLVEENPDKESEIRSFTAYYLPQTLKILSAYAKLEKQGVEGQNITEAKQRIEAMLDKLTDGYAAQLDRLFGTEVLDITSDITVMEQMLAKDGLLIDDLQKAQMEQKELTLEL